MKDVSIHVSPVSSPVMTLHDATRPANSVATKILRAVVIDVPAPVTSYPQTIIVALAMANANLAAVMEHAAQSAVSPAFRALSLVPGVVNTWDNAECHVVLCATDSRVVAVAPVSSIADIDALRYVGRFVHPAFTARVETTIDSVQFTTYEQIDLDENPVVVLPCQHFFSRRFVDVMLNIMAVYASDEHGQFVRVITPSQMIVQLKQCPDCRQLISGLHRYNRILKRAVLDISLKEVVSRYQLMYTEISEKFDDFETRLQNSRPAILNKILHIRDPRKIRPVTMHNMNLITQRIKSFSEIESQIQQYKHRVEEQIQPDMGLSFSAMSHVKDTGIERSTETHPLDVPMPQIKYQLTAHILELRLSAMLNDDITGLLPTFLSRGCEKEANRLYEEAAKQCKLSYEKGIKYKSECDRRRYWGHGVEIMLLQVQFISLIFRASTHTSAASTMPLQELGMTILHSCITYLRKYPPCQKYENAIHRLHCVFSGESLGESLHQTLSIDERKAIIRAMNAGLEGSGPWYQCSNDHPFTFGECGCPMQEMLCPECGDPPGGIDEPAG